MTKKLPTYQSLLSEWTCVFIKIKYSAKKFWHICFTLCFYARVYGNIQQHTSLEDGSGGCASIFVYIVVILPLYSDKSPHVKWLTHLSGEWTAEVRIRSPQSNRLWLSMVRCAEARTWLNTLIHHNLDHFTPQILYG